MSIRLAKGTPVVSLGDGVKLGTIDHVYLDPPRKEIVGFSFQRGGGLLGGKTSSVVDVSDVHGIGPDAVTLSDAGAVKIEVAVGDKRDGLVAPEDLVKRKVITESGTYVGQVTRIEVGADTHRLTQIEVSPGAFKTHALIDADEIEHIGAELVVVSDAVCGAASEPPLVTVP